MALNRSVIVVSSNLSLKHHPDRKPSLHTIQKISRALDLARDVAKQTQDRLASINSLTFLYDKLLRDALAYHFSIEKYDRVAITTIINALARIYLGLQMPVVFADVLSRTVWDPHDVKVVTKTTSHFGEVVDFDRDYEKETVLPGPYREMPGKDHVSGFVSPKKVMEGGKKVQKGYDAAKTYGPDDQGSIHLHFALCESIATTAIAYLIIHEASHKFAGTHDKAYADGLGNDVKYESLSIQDKSINADCYGYFCTSMMLGSMVRGKRDLYSSTRPEPPG